MGARNAYGAAGWNHVRVADGFTQCANDAFERVQDRTGAQAFERIGP